MMDTVPGWTDERVALLRRLWEEGLSASQIATQLTGVTRNAVIGKVHRLGLSGRVKSADTAIAGRKKATREAEVEIIVEEATLPPPVEPIVVEAVVAAATLDVALPADPVTLAVSRRVTIMDLREAMCRWPMGDPTSTDFYYCGDRAITGLPYCTHHAEIAYQPATERKRDRRAGGFR
ncbi:GcrA cell cycle regulator [Methylobacterium sp. Leaf399]|uniref:GcrA family cell cycle regulator n=1 Tax=unclassified Methylobacterium TaxID=2615210 RepID=UPI0007015F9D|nr:MULTISPECIES: GcrA family cell cycle regulator [unclassified Methylobacterium]KQP50266.1 GcrA cell cycle regulator [Methylobacterium sp. Leaf108]KQT07265.1 GcrA cell cycle regulator [Methylobacterium sp. Leaf399]